MEIDWRYKLKKKLIEFEDGKATIDQIEELVEEIIKDCMDGIISLRREKRRILRLQQLKEKENEMPY